MTLKTRFRRMSTLELKETHQGLAFGFLLAKLNKLHRMKLNLIAKELVRRNERSIDHEYNKSNKR